MTTKKLTKLLALYLPYILLGLAATNFGEAWRLAEGKALLSWSKKAVNISGLRSLILHRRQEFWNAISMKPIFPYKTTTICVYTIWSYPWGKL